MLIINIKDNESIDRALKRYKKKFERTGTMRQLRARTAFEKPSVRRRCSFGKMTRRQAHSNKQTTCTVILRFSLLLYAG